MPCGPQMVDRIKKAWDDGDAVFPLDQRAPLAQKHLLLQSAQPTWICTIDNETPWEGQHVESGDAAVIATSGTTGTPKSAILSLEALEASARAVHERLDVHEFDTWLCCLPPSHVGGFGVIARSLLTSTPVVAQNGFSVEGYNTAADHGATLVSLVPTALNRVSPLLYRTILLGGSAPPMTLPPNCVTTYGMTETGGGIVYNGIALTAVEIEIRESIIYVRSPMLMRQYRDGNSPIDTHGWLRTGDIGSRDDNGVLVVEGREGDLIITGGENVWPEHVEQILTTHPAVSECCIAGVPDDEWGQIVSAWIVLHPGSTLTLTDIREHVKKDLPNYCAPREIHIVANIPRTSLGKPQRKMLIQQRSHSTE
jgi:o-succinylbenzoate---CoA ligase